MASLEGLALRHWQKHTIKSYVSIVHEYERSLASLSGTDFQAEVCARLQSVNLGFQTVPAKPQGDAGLDGLSHRGECGYCCYGPEHDEFKQSRSRETAITKKFKADLRRLFELDIKDGKLFRSANAEMAKILPKGRKLKNIQLIVNWFESHRVLGPISTAVEEYREVSECRYVTHDVEVVVLGPRELANQYAVDEQTIMRARQRILIQRVQDTASAIEIDNLTDFDNKLKTLQVIRPDQTKAISALDEQLRKDWRTALAFERELDETLPTLHQMLEENRERILSNAAQLMLTNNDPGEQLIKAREFAKQLLDRDFGNLYGSLMHNVGSGEIARLIGECPIGWERPGELDA